MTFQNAADQRFYNDTFDVEFWQDDAFTLNDTDDALVPYSSRYRGKNPPRQLEKDGAPAIFAHAPSTVSFTPSPGLYRFPVRYGFFPGVEHPASDGATFAVTVRRAGGQVETLHSERLNPAHVPEDRRERVANPETEIRQGDTVEFVISSGANTNADWTYWRKLQPVNISESVPQNSGP